ncbi:hypothetical protein BJF83_14200 [Nocardiopsis sp. CNR-923]|nr:hypothetical protein BJF83_14200 [Nocardiopsis sp. CNR-923]
MVFDLSDFLIRAHLDARLTSAGWDGRLILPETVVDLSDIGAVYHRRCPPFDLPEAMNADEQRFARVEGRFGLGGVLASLGAHWVSHPSTMADAEYKPVQYAAAVRAGLELPPTWVGNVPESTSAFLARQGGAGVYKPLGGAFHVEGCRTQVVYANRITDTEELRDSALALTAHCFQQWVDKDYEVRVTVVGTRLFAVAIHATSEAAYVDWRTDYASHRYEVVEVPDTVREGLERYMRAFDLTYGAADFIVSPDGSWTLLEVNPNGEWGWLAHHCDLPIGQTIADLLEKGQT